MKLKNVFNLGWLLGLVMMINISGAAEYDFEEIKETFSVTIHDSDGRIRTVKYKSIVDEFVRGHVMPKTAKLQSVGLIPTRVESIKCVLASHDDMAKEENHHCTVNIWYMGPKFLDKK